MLLGMRCAPLLLLLTGCPPPAWEIVGADLDEALLSIWGTGGGEVWAVGGDVGGGPLVLHLDGEAWERIDTDTRGDLWWVWGEGSRRWMVGAGGRVLVHDVGEGTTTEEILEEGVTLFGIWGAEGHRWAVGGDLDLQEAGARLWHAEGDGGWAAVDLPAEAAATHALYKVWGTGPEDVWVVGTGGLTLHRDAEGWSVVASPVSRTLFTVHGAGEERYAVGGVASGTILRGDGTGWIDDTPAILPQTNGVFLREGCEPVAVGQQGAVYTRGAEGWVPDPREGAPFEELHAVWVDEACGVWSVGGALASAPLTDGVLIYGGESPPPPIP